jgi:hypothetical protein
MNFCTQDNCGKPVENRDLMLCSTHNKLRRKIDSIKLPEDPKPIKKVSDIQSKLLAQYAVLKKKFILKKWCAYHGKPCLPTDIHHQLGREGSADDKEIPLLLDTRYWIPVCREAHTWITDNSKEAIEQGYSFSRLTKKQSV